MRGGLLNSKAVESRRSLHKYDLYLGYISENCCKLEPMYVQTFLEKSSSKLLNFMFEITYHYKVILLPLTFSLLTSTEFDSNRLHFLAIFV